MNTQESDWNSRIIALFVMSFFGAALPFMVVGQFHAEENCTVLPSFEKYGAKKPYPVISDHTEYDKAVIDVIDSSYRQELAAAKNEGEVMPRYALLLKDVHDTLAVSFGFFQSNVSLWNSIVFITALCVMQWVSGVWVYFFSRNIAVSLRLNMFNIGCASLAFLCLWTHLFPSLSFIGAIFYYVLPIPVLICWLLYGLVYFYNMIVLKHENLFTNSLYAFWHYCGFLVMFNYITNCSVPWLPGASS
jgi:hypothetical protein